MRKNVFFCINIYTVIKNLNDKGVFKNNFKHDSIHYSYNVRPAFGSVSSELSGRNNASGPFSRRYKENWEAFPEEDENISYFIHRLD